MPETDTAAIELTADQQGRLDAYIRRIRSFAFRIWMLTKLPMAWLAGCRVTELTETTAAVRIRHRWLIQNPFRSTYFAVQSMAGEMATGLLGLMYIEAAGVPMSILVVKMESEFVKKATGITTFTCTDGHTMRELVFRALETGEGETIRTESIGMDQDGNHIATFWITWSVKKKSKRS